MSSNSTIPGPSSDLSRTTSARLEVLEYMDMLDGELHGALSLRQARKDLGPDEIDYEEIYSDYAETQEAFMKTANKCLAKLNQPPMEVGNITDWVGVQSSMERACDTIGKMSARDKDLSGLLGKLKKTFRSFCKHAGGGKMFTALIPSDTFGSVLCGGLNVIFTALEQTGFHREAVYKALERLPRILDDHAEYMELAGEDREIHRRTARLYTAVCLTLDHILRWFMLDAFVAGAKRLINPSAFTNNLSERVADVNLAAKDLRARGIQVMWRQIKDISTTQKWMWYENVKMGRDLNEINQNIKQRAERSASYDSIERTVRDSLQPLLENTMQRLITKNTRSQISTFTATSDQVLKELKYDPTLIPNDIELLLQLGSPSSTARLDRSRVRNLQGNARMRAWLSVDENSMLLVNGGSSKMDLSTSFVCANLVNSLRQQASSSNKNMAVVPLAYFCSQHRDYRRDEGASPLELCMSLLLQLIDGYPGFSTVDLQECLDNTDPRNAASICSSFGNLLNRLSSTAVVYLVVDGLSFFAVPPERMNLTREAVELLVNLFRQPRSMTVKFLFCSPIRFKFLEEFFEEDEILNVATLFPSTASGRAI